MQIGKLLLLLLGAMLQAQAPVAKFSSVIQQDKQVRIMWDATGLDPSVTRVAVRIRVMTKASAAEMLAGHDVLDIDAAPKGSITVPPIPEGRAVYLIDLTPDRPTYRHFLNMF